MANKWTDQQFAAITAQNSNILVSAAAGSGKTAVLVERIIKKITDTQNPIDIDRLLIVTFTNAAASEMRERIAAAISKTLEQNPDSEILARQLVLIHKASITTIHSFCLEVIRTNFNLAGTDPNFRIADTTENDLLRLEALDEIMDEMYEDAEYGEDFASLLDGYSNVKNSTEFNELILKIYDFVMSLPNPKKWLKEAYEKFAISDDCSFDDTFWAIELVDSAKNMIQQLMLLYDDIIHKTNIDSDMEQMQSFLIQEKENVSMLLEAKNYNEMYHLVQAFTFLTIPRAKKNDQSQYREYIKTVRDSIKKKIQSKLMQDVFKLSSDGQKQVVLKLYPQMRCLSELVCRLIDKFNEKKSAKNLLNFNDLEHICLKLFRDNEGNPTELASATAKKHDEILIDEYQDTSKLQESIFSSIKKENSLFMVGDIKQSIYRFRNTDPLLFRDKKDSFLDDEDAIKRKIILSKNFRSRKEVLTAINFIFDRIMSKEVGEIEYDSEEMLYAGLTYPETPNPISTDTELHMIDLGATLTYDEEKSMNEDEEETDDADENEDGEGLVVLEKMEAEAVLAAKRIQELMLAKYQVFGKNGYKIISYKDICILLRSTKNWANVFTQTLSLYGIPVFSDSGGGFLASVEIDIILSLLKVIDNPYQDIPLIAVLRSPLYNLTTNDLAQIRVTLPHASFFEAALCKSKDTDVLGMTMKQVLNDLLTYREKSKFMKLDELLWDIYMQTGYYESVGVLANGLLKQSNLRILAIRAGDYEKTGYKGLYNFIQFIDRYKAMGGDYDAARLIGEEQDVVRIMSIHKSKGLEFPVVLLCGIGKKFNKQDLNKSVLIHPKYGYGPKFVDPDLRVSYPNAMKTSIKTLVEQEGISEEMRILYVALTRAREKLILIGSLKNAEKRIFHLGLGMSSEQKLKSYKTISAISYLDWFIMALIQHPDCEILLSSIDYNIPQIPNESTWSVHFYGANSDFNPLEVKTADTEQTPAEEHQTEELVALAGYSYPHLADMKLPTKLTVTELKRRYTGQDDETGVFLYPRPSFLTEEDTKLAPNQRGIAVHTVMEHLDFSKQLTLEEIQRQIKEFTEHGLLTEPEAESVDIQKILRFCNSDVGQLMQKADKINREVMFAIHLKASELGLGFESDSNILLQGVIDCVVINGDELILIDYKTDKVQDITEIVEKYKVQLAYYQIAAEKIYQKKVGQKILYLFDIDRAIKLV